MTLLIQAVRVGGTRFDSLGVCRSHSPSSDRITAILVNDSNRSIKTRKEENYEEKDTPILVVLVLSTRILGY